MSYKIAIRKQALKELEHFPVHINKKISKKIDSLTDNPRPRGCRKLKGEHEELWRIKSGDYRIIYSIDDT
ncbi:MAG: type II toxin-antitoxin system RelE/ParE family toxin, partial [Bacteroidota bacterium]